MEVETREERPTLKSVTIRGVDGGTYDEFSSVVQMAGLTMGEAVTKMMADVMRDFDEVFPDLSAASLKLMAKKDKIKVKHHRKLSISKTDLEEADRSVKFQHIDELTFEEDVTKEVFNTYVRGVEHCQNVRVPSILPKLLIYSKIGFTSNIEIYQVGSEQQ